MADASRPTVAELTAVLRSSDGPSKTWSHEAAAQLETLDARCARLSAALKLARVVAAHRTAHLGRSRLSGIGQGCIVCICDIALGDSADSDCVDTEDFTQELERLTSPDRHEGPVRG